MVSSGTVSIIVAVYNEEGKLERSLNALRRQSYRDIEVLMMDDGSTDGSPAIMARFAEEDSRFRYFRLQNGGPAAARNAGLERFTGDYLAFADGDDLVDAHYIERLLEILLESGLEVSCCMACDTEEHGQKEYIWRERRPAYIRTVEDCDFRLRESHRVVWGAVYTRKAVEGLRFREDLRSSTDTLFFAQVLKKCRRIVQTNDELYCYIIRQGSVSKRPFDRSRFSDLLVWEEVADMYADEPGVGGESAGEVLYRKCRSALEEIRQSEQPDRELAEDVRKVFQRNRKRFLNLPVPPKKKAAMLVHIALGR